MKATYATQDEIPEALRDEFEQKATDGPWTLKLEDVPAGFSSSADLAEAKSKLGKFRDDNVELLKSIAELSGVEKADIKDLSPLKAVLESLRAENTTVKEEIESLRTAAESGKKKGDEAKKKADEEKQAEIKSIVADYHEKSVKPLQERIEKADSDRDAAIKTANAAILRSAIADKFVAAGGQAKAADFIVEKGTAVFSVKDGEVVAENKYSVADPSRTLSVEEWLVDAAKDYDFAFKPSGGGGAEGAPGNQTPAGVQELKSGSMTPQELGKLSHQDSSKFRIV